MLVIEVKIENTIFLLINIYNANTETEQRQTLSNLSNILKTFDDIHNKSIIFGGDFNLFLDICVDTNGKKNSLKKKSTAHLIQIIENYDLCDIWRIRHPKTKRFTFRQNHSSGFIQRRLDFFFISNSLQEMTKYTDILAAFSTDHSPILITLSKINEFDRGKGFWKFNNSLKKNEDYVETIKNVIKSTLRSLDEQGVNNPQARWEFLKYEIRKNYIQFSKTLSKNRERLELENKLKVFEANSVLQCDNEYLDCKE